MHYTSLILGVLILAILRCFAYSHPQRSWMVSARQAVHADELLMQARVEGSGWLLGLLLAYTLAAAWVVVKSREVIPEPHVWQQSLSDEGMAASHAIDILATAGILSSRISVTLRTRAEGTEMAELLLERQVQIELFRFEGLHGCPPLADTELWVRPNSFEDRLADEAGSGGGQWEGPLALEKREPADLAACNATGNASSFTGWSSIVNTTLPRLLRCQQGVGTCDPLLLFQIDVAPAHSYRFRVSLPPLLPPIPLIISGADSPVTSSNLSLSEFDRVALFSNSTGWARAGMVAADQIHGVPLGKLAEFDAAAKLAARVAEVPDHVGIGESSSYHEGDLSPRWTTGNILSGATLELSAHSAHSRTWAVLWRLALMVLTLLTRAWFRGQVSDFLVADRLPEQLCASLVTLCVVLHDEPLSDAVTLFRGGYQLGDVVKVSLPAA